MTRKTDDRMTRRVTALAAAKPVEGGALAKSVRKKSRSSDRKTTYRFGRVLNGSREEHPCILRNVSDTGARVVFEGEASLSDEVILRIELTGERKKARVVWQKDREAGLSFV